MQHGQGDNKLSVFLSKRIWQIVSLIDNYADCTVDMYNIRFENKESLKERNKKIKNFNSLVKSIKQGETTLENLSKSSRANHSPAKKAF